MCLYIISPLTPDGEEDMTLTTERGSIRPLLSSYDIMIALLSASTASFAIGYTESLLQIHLQIFQLSVGTVGLTFLAMSAAYTACTVASGWLVDRRYTIIYDTIAYNCTTIQDSAMDTFYTGASYHHHLLFSGGSSPLHPPLPLPPPHHLLPGVARHRVRGSAGVQLQLCPVLCPGA